MSREDYDGPHDPDAARPRHRGRYTLASYEADQHVAARRARANTFAEQVVACWRPGRRKAVSA